MFNNDHFRFLSEGKAGKVLKVKAKKRTGAKNFISTMRLTLTDYFTADKTVALGGVFLLKEGKAREHVMQHFSTVPLLSEEDVNNWLTFHEFPAPLIAVGTFLTNEADLDLRLQHFHNFSKHGKGGHYHNGESFLLISEKLYEGHLFYRYNP